MTMTLAPRCALLEVRVARVGSVGAVGVGAQFAGDTSSDALERVVDRWRSMSPREKLDEVAALNLACEQLAQAGARTRHPAAGELEIRRRVTALRLGRELMISAYDWDPHDQGW
jgi:hypothetical protein